MTVGEEGCEPSFDEEGSQFLDQRKQAKMLRFRIPTTAM